MNWYLKVLKQYADFKGRARRKEYWMFVLFNFLFFIVFSITSAVVDLEAFAASIGVVMIVYLLAIIIPGLAVTVRRLHDIGKSGTWFFIYFVPVIGGIWLLVLLCTEGNRGPNQYGADPKTEKTFEDEVLDSDLTF